MRGRDIGFILFGAVLVVATAVSWVTAQTGGGMMTGEPYRYGDRMMGGYLVWWAAYGIVKAAVVGIGLWLLYRIAIAVEKIAASKS